MYIFSLKISFSDFINIYNQISSFTILWILFTWGITSYLFVNTIIVYLRIFKNKKSKSNIKSHYSISILVGVIICLFLISNEIVVFDDKLFEVKYNNNLSFIYMLVSSLIIPIVFNILNTKKYERIKNE